MLDLYSRDVYKELKDKICIIGIILCGILHSDSYVTLIISRKKVYLCLSLFQKWFKKPETINMISKMKIKGGKENRPEGKLGKGNNVN